MHLPTPQFSRLVTVLSFDLANSSLDSMVLAWDHIAARYLRRPTVDRAVAGKIESIRLLAIHDAVNAIFGPGAGFVFNESSTGHTTAAAVSAVAQASHDILSNAFGNENDLIDLAISLGESLSLVADLFEKSVGRATGAASAAAFIKTFGPLGEVQPPTGIALPPEPEWRRSA